ncbi:MAG: hypothetical protein ACXVMS_02660 [Flavisolibacter sp.]
MKSLGLLLAEKLIDIDLLDKTLGSYVITSWEKSKQQVLDMSVKHAHPFLAAHFQ